MERPARTDVRDRALCAFTATASIDAADGLDFARTASMCVVTPDETVGVPGEAVGKPNMALNCGLETIALRAFGVSGAIPVTAMDAVPTEDEDYHD